VGWLISAVVAGLLAGTLTLAELEKVFNVPPTMRGWDRCKLFLLRWGFVAGNALLAAVLSYALDEVQVVKETNPWLKGLLIGASYSALIRAKFTTFSLRGQEVPVGLETFYEGFKDLAHRRINDIIRRARTEEVMRLIAQNVPALRDQARALVMSDALIGNEELQKALTWIDDVAGAQAVSDGDRRTLLATFIVTGQMRPRF
jgi:hypothetical protein